MSTQLTAPAVRSRKVRTGSEPLVMVTAYDAPGARIADEAGVDLILVGDSLAMVVLGYDDTLSVTVDDMAHHTAAVARARPRPLVVADMPWMSYHVSREETVRNAARLIQAGGQAVKLEGGTKRVPMIEAIIDAEIPVMGHIGLTPQSVHAMGGFKVQGKETGAALALVDEAKALEAAGCFSIVLEGVPDEVGRMVTDAVTVPTIGIGAGPHCDGQVLVFHDVLGLQDRITPKFVRRYATLKADAVDAIGRVRGRRAGWSLPGRRRELPPQRHRRRGARPLRQRDAGPRSLQRLDPIDQTSPTGRRGRPRGRPAVDDAAQPAVAARPAVGRCSRSVSGACISRGADEPADPTLAPPPGHRRPPRPVTNEDGSPAFPDGFGTVARHGCRRSADADASRAACCSPTPRAPPARPDGGHRRGPGRLRRDAVPLRAGRAVGFWMRNTRIPLSIAYFGDDGTRGVDHRHGALPRRHRLPHLPGGRCGEVGDRGAPGRARRARPSTRPRSLTDTTQPCSP